MKSMNEPLTKREVEYLLSVELLTQDAWPARITDIAKSLGVKTPSAVELVNGLIAKKLLQRGPSGIRLTGLGARELQGMHRSHRLLESMLLRIGMKPAEACTESRRIDLYSSKELLRAICKYLGHPVSCPHKMQITPDPGCCPERLS
ncbi:MAG TPA: metal-dependent transcriptional regulator [Candidatus Bathyarchaeia archaeon]|nr:metal-dependent transcriptional regulator [Candidatus Bathyarchaeia archaeon]